MDSCKAQVEAGLAAVERATSGLSSFLIKPKELVGGDLIRHMVQKRLNDPMIKSHEPRVYLDLSCSKEKIQYLAPGKKDLRKSIIMRFPHGDGAKMKLATRKLDNLAYIKPYGGVQNDHERLCRLKNNLEFSQLLATIFILGRAEGRSASEGRH
jgi:hypothetical protein